MEPRAKLDKRAGREAAKASLQATKSLRDAKRAYRTAATPFLGLRFHDLRHHCITKLAEVDVPDQTLMASAGHVSREMLGHYSHIRMQAKREAVAALEPQKAQKPAEVLAVA